MAEDYSTDGYPRKATAGTSRPTATEAVQETKRTSQLPAVDGWHSLEYLRNYEKLIMRMHPQELMTKCHMLSLLGYYELAEIDVEKRPYLKNATILKVLERSASLFGTFREILHCIPNCRDIAKELDSVGPTRTTDKDCLHARQVLEKNGNVSTGVQSGSTPPSGPIPAETDQLSINQAIATVAIRTEQVEVKRVRFVILGKHGTGKTSLVRAFLGQVFVKDGDSTDIVHIIRNRLRLHDSEEGVGVFSKRAIFIDLPCSATLLADQTVQAVRRKEKSEANISAASARAQERSGRSANAATTLTAADHLPATPDAVPQLPAPREKDRHQRSEWLKLQGISPELMDAMSSVSEEELKESAYVELVDCAGQMTMAGHQTVCLNSSQTVFILVTDVRKPLGEIAGDEVYRYHGQLLKSQPLFPEMTEGDYVSMWLSTMSLQQKGQLEPTTVFLVATHIDEVDDPAAVKEAYCKAVKELVDERQEAPLTGNAPRIRGPYFTDNRSVEVPESEKSEESQMAKLQEDLAEFVNCIPAERVQLLQLKVENALEQLYESASSDSKEPYMTYEKFVMFARCVSQVERLPEATVREWLRDYRKHGIVVCHDCDNPQSNSIVFTSVKWLLAQFMEVISCPLKAQAGERLGASIDFDVEVLWKQGIASSHLLQHLWRKFNSEVQAALADVMVMLHLACYSWESSSGGGHSGAAQPMAVKSLYVPFSVGEAVVELPAALRDGAVLPALKLLFPGCQYFPPPLFGRLAMLIYSDEDILSRSLKVSYGCVHFALKEVHAYVSLTWTQFGLVAEMFATAEWSSAARRKASAVRKLIGKHLSVLRREGFPGLVERPAVVCKEHGHDQSSVHGQWWKERSLPWVNLEEGGTWCEQCGYFACLPDGSENWLSEVDMPSLSISSSSSSSATKSPDAVPNNAYRLEKVETPAPAQDVHGGSCEEVRQQVHDRQSDPRCGESDPWQSADYLGCYAQLIQTMDPDEVKTLCYTLQLISVNDKQAINSKSTPSLKNEAILDFVARSSSHFGKFREVLHFVDVCSDIAKKLDRIGPRRDQDEGCRKARDILNPSLTADPTRNHGSRQ